MVDFSSIEITSRKNDIVKYAQFLLTSKGRKGSFSYRFDGLKLFCEAVKCGVEIDKILIRSEDSASIFASMDSLCTDWREVLCAEVICIKEGVFSAISDENAPEGIICIAKYLDKSEKSGKIIRRDFFDTSVLFKKKAQRIMALESVRDPGNLGTIIRTCKAFLVDRLMLSSDCADILSPKVIRSSMGAVFALDVQVCNDLVAELTALKSDGYRILATALYGESVPLSKACLSQSDLFVIGNEGHGLSDAMLSAADTCVYIDMYSGPGCESLNAGVAAAVCAWEQKRQTDNK